MEVVGRLRGPLTITCRTCEHSSTWSPKEASRRLGAECTVPSARRKLRCSACGERRSMYFVFSSP